MLLQIPGKLVMGTDVPDAAGVAASWGDVPLNGALMVAAAVLFLANLGNLYRILPQLVKCLYAWRRNLLIEGSVSLIRARSYACLAMMLPLCLLISRYRLFGEKMLSLFPARTLSLGAVAFMAAFVLLRYLMYLVTGVKQRRRSIWKIAHAADSNYFLLMMGALLPLAGLLILFSAPDEVIKNTLSAVCSVFYLIFVVGKYQILSSEFHPFSTILYLCGLEFLPLGIFIWSCL